VSRSTAPGVDVPAVHPAVDDCRHNDDEQRRPCEDVCLFFCSVSYNSIWAERWVIRNGKLRKKLNLYVSCLANRRILGFLRCTLCIAGLPRQPVPQTLPMCSVRSCNKMLRSPPVCNRTVTTPASL